MSLSKLKSYWDALKEFHKINYETYKNGRRRELLKRNAELHNIHAGERIVIILTGKSVDNIDFKLLKNEYVFGCNRLSVHKNFEDLDVDFFADVDTWTYRLIVMYRWWSEFIYARTKPGTKLFWGLSACGFVKDILGFRESDTYYISSNSSFTSTDNIAMDITGPTNIVTGGCFTAMILIAIYMGFKEIYLIGADYSKDPMISGHFYDKRVDYNQPKESLIHRNSVLNQFAQDNGATIYNVVDEGFESRTFQQVRTQDFINIISDESPKNKTQVPAGAIKYE